MKTFRRVGWQFESSRHGLAARGIKTSYMAKKSLSATIVPPILESGKNVPAKSRAAGEQKSGIAWAIAAGERTPGDSRAAGESMGRYMARKRAETRSLEEQQKDFERGVDRRDEPDPQRRYNAKEGMYRLQATLEHHNGKENQVAVLVPKTEAGKHKAEVFLRKLAEKSNADLEIEHVKEVNVEAHKKPKIMFNKGEFYTSDLDADVEQDRLEMP